MAERVDLKGIRDEIKSVLDALNTTTGSPIDLSANMTQRVRKVLSIHPERIGPQASFFPLVTSYIEEKDIIQDDMAGSQLNAKRRSSVTVSVVGAVWNQNMSTNLEDPADNDINYLMENVELGLRSNANLNSKVKWQIADSVRYYFTALDEQTHLRSGLLTLKCTVYY